MTGLLIQLSDLLAAMIDEDEAEAQRWDTFRKDSVLREMQGPFVSK